MATFAYTARNANGQVVKGRLEAPDRKRAVQQLGGLKLRPVSLTERAEKVQSPSEGRSGLGRLFGKNGATRSARAGFSRKQMLPFFRSLSDLLACGIQVGDAIRLLAKRLT
ncbi:MAG: hypothetical protein R3F07_15160, partial [Opitutaceae bacterium]